jgi:hypothetical protein
VLYSLASGGKSMGFFVAGLGMFAAFGFGFAKSTVLPKRIKEVAATEKIKVACQFTVFVKKRGIM